MTLLRDVTVLYAVWALMLGATAAGLTVALRALPWVRRRVEEAEKPWACDVCLSFWTTALVGLCAAAWRHDVALVVLCGPAYPWAMWVLRKITDPHGPPPLPPLEEATNFSGDS